MKLATKEQELREALAQIQSLKQQLLTPHLSNSIMKSLPETQNGCNPSINKDDENYNKQNSAVSQDFCVLSDPSINYIYSLALDEIETLKSKLKCAQDEIKAAKFEIESSVGRKLIKKCRLLRKENIELSKEFTRGAYHQLEVALKMERSHRIDMEHAFLEIDNLIQLYENQIEVLQSVIIRQNQDLKKFSEIST